MFNYPEIARQYAEKHGLDLDIADEYGEPGYTSDKPILFANWNRWKNNLPKRMEDAGYELEWSDEWITTYHHGTSKAYRTSPDCYHWQPSVQLGEYGEYLTPDDPGEDWFEEGCITDQAQDFRFAIPNWVEVPPDWVKVDDDGEEFECGWYRRDDQQLMLDTTHKLLESGKAEQVAIQKTRQEQFRSSYVIWYVPKEQGDE